MHFKYSPMFQALLGLDDVLPSSAAYTGRTEQLLICVALARLEATERLHTSLDELAAQGDWTCAAEAGLQPTAVSLLSDLFGRGRISSQVLLSALAIVKRLAQELKNAPDSAWDVLPFVTSPERRSLNRENFFLAQPVVELMLDMLHGEKGSVWVPFDASGQISISALRRGYQVNRAAIDDRVDLTVHLLTIIETGGAAHPRLFSEVRRDSNGRPTTSADFIIAAPPFGPHARSNYWTQWELSNDLQPYDRAEAWAVSELLPRTNRRLIVISSRNWLFSTGQEKRLRKDLLAGPKTTLESVTTLPAGSLSSSNILTAIVTFDLSKQSGDIRMTNIESDEERGTSINELIAAQRNHALGVAGENKKSRLIALREIQEAEYVLLPQRLLNKEAFGGENTIALGELCDAVRPTTPYKNSDAERAQELGIPNLKEGKWRPVRVGDTYPIETKLVNVRPQERKEVYLRQDDILLSVKGTLGLARLVSDFYETNDVASDARAVVSSSCIALRFDRYAPSRGITPRFLLMYLRSAEGQEQIRALQVGAGMPHISIQSLLNAMRIPVPTPEEAVAVEADFEKLCSLEEHMDEIKQRIESITESRWSVKLA